MGENITVFYFIYSTKHQQIIRHGFSYLDHMQHVIQVIDHHDRKPEILDMHIRFPITIKKFYKIIFSQKNHTQ